MMLTQLFLYLSFVALLGSFATVSVRRHHLHVAAREHQAVIQEAALRAMEQAIQGPVRVNPAIRPLWDENERELFGFNDTEAFIKATERELNGAEWDEKVKPILEAANARVEARVLTATPDSAEFDVNVANDGEQIVVTTRHKRTGRAAQSKLDPKMYDMLEQVRRSHRQILAESIAPERIDEGDHAEVRSWGNFDPIREMMY